MGCNQIEEEIDMSLKRENKLRITGNAVANMELNTYEGANGTFDVAVFTLAVNRVPTKANPKPGCDFINVRVYGDYANKLAEFGIAKGDKVTAEGELRVNTKQQDDGSYKTFVHLKAFDVSNWSAWAERKIDQVADAVADQEEVKEAVPVPF
jgi:single-stranded DNA-binding protein